jgi:hypothetical protein
MDPLPYRFDSTAIGVEVRRRQTRNVNDDAAELGAIVTVGAQFEAQAVGQAFVPPLGDGVVRDRV